MVTSAVALSEPATRRNVRRRILFALAVTVVAIALLVVAAWLALADRSTNAVQQNGVKTEATVVAIVSAPSGRGQFAAGSATVQFPVDGQPRQASINTGTNISDVQQGQTLAIVYDKTDPSRAEIQGVRASSTGLPFVPVVFVGVLMVGMAVVATRHVLALRRLLGSQPWTPVACRIEQVPVGRGGTRVVVKLDTADGIRIMETIGLNRVDPGIEPEAWVVGLPARRLAVALPGGGHIVYLRSVRTR